MSIFVGILFYSFVAAVGIFVISRVVGLFTHNEPPRRMWGASAPVCIPGRDNCLTGMYGDDRPEYGRGEEGVPVRETHTQERSFATTYAARPAGSGKRAPMTAPTHDDNWDYPVEIPAAKPTLVQIPVKHEEWVWRK